MSSEALPLSLRDELRAHPLRGLQRLTERPLFAYGMLLLLQLKVMWGIWHYRDLTSGDTTDYLRMGYLWYSSFVVDIIWSPLYTAFYGTLLFLTTNAYIVTILHRLIIVLVLGALVLALMRRLLPPGLAWMVAAWWSLLPINFSALYEVHLFAVIPILALWLLSLRRPSPWTRGATLALLAATTLLVRNELIVATGLLALTFLVWELRSAWKARAGGKPRTNLGVYVAAYGLPLLLAAAICLFFLSRSVTQWQDLQTAGAPKHTINMCQVYAFGYQQRHPEWTKSPWTQCYDLMETTFGDKLLPLSEMIRRNPWAVIKHFLWNISLTPNGLQVLLFNASSGTVNPDYAPAHLGQRWVLVPSIVLAAIVALGLVLLYRERHYWWESWLRERAGGWLAMLAVAAVALVIIPTQRPRPSYLFSLGIFLMALSAMCLFVISRRLPTLQRLSRWVPLAMVALVLVVPGYYSFPEHQGPRPLRELYQRLLPFQPIIARPDTVLVVNAYPTEVSNLIAHTSLHYRDVLGLGPSVNIFDYAIFNQATPGTPPQKVLEQHKVNLFYINEEMWRRLEATAEGQTLLTRATNIDWTPIALQNLPGERWMLLQHIPPLSEDAAALLELNGDPDIGPPEARQALATTGALPTDGLFMGKGWYPYEIYAGEHFRWVNNNAEIVVTKPSGQQQRLTLDLEFGPGVGSQPFDLQLLDATGKIIATTHVEGRQQIQLDLPLVAGQSSVFRLHVIGGGQLKLDDPRILNFRVFSLAWTGNS